MFKDKVNRELKRKKLNPLSKRQLNEMTEYKEFKEHTQIIELGEHVTCKIRLQETTYPGSKPEIGVDIRKFLHGKYPFKSGKMGILIEKNKWLDFLQAAIVFTTSVWGPEVFYDEPEPQTQPTEPVKNVHHGASQDDLRRMSVTEVKWGELSKMSKKKN